MPWHSIHDPKLEACAVGSAVQERCPEGEFLHKTHSLGIPVTLPP